nr:hypothetical protein [Tanacetum cinerariifolium]
MRELVLSFVEKFSCEEFSCDKVVCLEDEKRRGYVIDEYTDDEAKYSRYNDDYEGEISCSENGDSDDVDADDEDSDDKADAYLVEEFLSFMHEFISCDKVHSVKEGVMSITSNHQNSTKVNKIQHVLKICSQQIFPPISISFIFTL